MEDNSAGNTLSVSVRELGLDKHPSWKNDAFRKTRKDQSI
jgi:hypothetical protein